jgi:hypothetical protein
MRRSPSCSSARAARRPKRSVAAVILLAVSLALGACGSSQSAGSSSRSATRPATSSNPPVSAPSVLDTKKIERAIARSILVQRGRRASVSCPANVSQREGLAFSCAAVLDGARTRFVVTELNASGYVHYQAY